MRQNVLLKGHRGSVEIIQKWKEVVLWNYSCKESRDGIKTLKPIFRVPHESPMVYCFSLDFFGTFFGFLVFQEKSWFELVMFFMFYSMIGKFKITQWQHCWICLQQVGHVEIYIFLIKTYKQVRVSPDDSICSCCDLWIMNGVTCDIFLILLAVVAEIVIEKNGMHVW